MPFKLIHEISMSKTNNLNINNGMFLVNSLSSLLFYIAQISLFIEVKNTTSGFKITTKK